MISCFNMSSRLYFSLYSRWPNRHRPSQLISRHCTSRYLLRSRPLPLCTLNRSCLRHHRGIRSLIPIILRIYTQFNMSKNSLRNYIRRCKPNILPPTLPRFIRNTSTIFRLPRCIHNMKYYLINRLFHLINSSHTNNFHYLRGLRIQTRSVNGRSYLH